MLVYMPVTHWSGVLNLQNSILQHAELMTEYRNRGREPKILRPPMIGWVRWSMNRRRLSVSLRRVGRDEPYVAAGPGVMWNHHHRATATHRGVLQESVVQDLCGGTERASRWSRRITPAWCAGSKTSRRPDMAAKLPCRPKVNDTAIPKSPSDHHVRRCAWLSADGITLKSRNAFSESAGRQYLRRHAVAHR